MGFCRGAITVPVRILRAVSAFLCSIGMLRIVTMRPLVHFGKGGTPLA